MNIAFRWLMNDTNSTSVASPIIANGYVPLRTPRTSICAETPCGGIASIVRITDVEAENDTFVRGQSLRASGMFSSLK